MRKRKAKVTWLPVDINNRLGTAPVAVTNPEIGSSHFIQALTGPPLGDPATTSELPIVFDQSGSGLVFGAGLLENQSLADITQSGYRLRRIVGKLFFGCGQSAVRIAGDVTTVIVTAGIIVRRVDANGVSLATAGGGGLQLQSNTATLDNIMDPWIWRRSWMLSNLLDPVNNDGLIFPTTSNISYGSALDGAHIDQKTARIVGPEERLFLNVTCQGINGNAQSEPLLILLVGDLRVLASMRSQVGNRRNASR